MDRERRAFALFALKIDRASMGPDDVLDEIQSQPHSFHLPRKLSTATVEFFENARPILFLNSNTSIANRNR